MNATIIDTNKGSFGVSLGETLGNRQDAVVRKFVPVMEQELELAA